MATIQGQINTPRDTTFQSTETTPRNIADVLVDELSGIAQALGGSTDYDDLSHRPQINSVTLTGNKSADDLSLAMQEDLTSIKATGTTNATGSTITSGTYFYLNGTLCQAKSDIANGATFTLNTNYEVVTAGGLNSLNSALNDVIDVSSDIVIPATSGTSWGITAKIKNGLFSMCIPYFIPAQTGDNQTIATGLPKALCQMQGMCGGSNAGNTAVITGAGTGFWINAGGTSLMGHIGANSASRAHWIYIQYQIDES